MKLKKILTALCIIGCLILVGIIVFLPTNDFIRMSFSEKINKGYTGHILINGDSIGGSIEEGEWCSTLKDLIEKNNSASIEIKNISKPGNSTFAGIVSWEMLDGTEQVLSDLVILCYGQNDIDDDTFIVNYEALIRNTIAGNPNAEIIAILESAQKEYTNKIKSIIELCDYYGIPYVDTIKAFRDSGYSYNELSDDGTHPNSIGKRIYANAIYNVVKDKLLEKKNILDFKGERPKRKKPLNIEAEKLASCQYIPVEKMTRVNNTLSTTIPKCSIIGFDIMFTYGDHEIKMSLPYEENEYTFEYSWDYEFEQRHIYPVLFGKYKQGEITIFFDESNITDKFLGLVYFE